MYAAMIRNIAVERIVSDVAQHKSLEQRLNLMIYASGTMLIVLEDINITYSQKITITIHQTYKMHTSTCWVCVTRSDS